MGMTREDRDWIEAGLNTLCTDAGVVSNADCGQVRKYIDVGEYGLALDDLADIHLATGKPIPPDRRALFDTLAMKMGIRHGDEWQAVAAIRAIAS